MDAQGFLAALAPAVSDADARERFLADPRAVLAAAGLDLPQWFAVSAREGDAAELTITLPALSDPDTDLSDADLDAVAGLDMENAYGRIYRSVCMRGARELVSELLPLQACEWQTQGRVVWQRCDGSWRKTITARGGWQGSRLM